MMRLLRIFFSLLMISLVEICSAHGKEAELPEVVVVSKNNKVLHMLAYVREYSTMTTFTDTVFLFREKMVDFMLPSKGIRYKGWKTPRVLTSRSYFRFTDSLGLDSVSDLSRHHFSWSDWMGVIPILYIPRSLSKTEFATDTVWGRFSPAEIWTKHNDSIAVNVDVLADTSGEKWVGSLSGFFKKGLEFNRLKISYDFENVLGDTITALELTGYKIDMESTGRGHEMFRFNRKDEPFFVQTSADVYVLDKEFITLKEAKRWEKADFDIEDIGIYESVDAPPLSTDILTLIWRVENIDKNLVKLDFIPDQNMISQKLGGRNFKIGRRALLMLKEATGITRYRARRNFNRQWDGFRREIHQSNQSN